MSVVLRGFVTPWPDWASRWRDVGMQPAFSPMFLADRARDGVIVGPYVDPRGRLRADRPNGPPIVVCYDSLADAEWELKLRPTDFRPWASWLKGSLVGAGAADYEVAFAARITGALAHLRAPIVPESYIQEIVGVGIDLVTVIGNHRKGPANIPPEYQAKLDERDREVEANARRHMGRFTEKPRESN